MHTRFPSHPPRASIRYRFWAGCITLFCIGLLSLAAIIKPHPTGIGSHQQLNLPPCGFYLRTGYPCPTCGMTTAFALTVRGQLFHAWQIQPAGTLAALACILLILVSGYAAIAGRRLDKITTKLNWQNILITAACVVLASWLWKCYSVWVQAS